MAASQYMGREAQGATQLKETALDDLYSTYSEAFMKNLEGRFGDFPGFFASSAKARSSTAFADKAAQLQQSPEYWQALDEAYAGFRDTLEKLNAAGKLTLKPGQKIPVESMAKAEILIRTEYTIAVEGFKSLGLDKAWSRLGKHLKKNMSDKVGVKTLGASQPTKYAQMLSKDGAADEFAAKLTEAKDLLGFLKSVTGNDQMALKIYNALKKENATDFKLLEAAVQMKVPPNVAELPKVGWRAWFGGKWSWYWSRNFAQILGGVKTLKKLAELIAGRGRYYGSRAFTQGVYRSYATAKWTDRVTLPWLVIAGGGLYIAYKLLFSPKIGMDSKPRKDPMSDALRTVAASNLNRRNISKMLDGLEVGGKKLSEREKIRALNLAARSKEGALPRTLTDYVRALAILQFMPGRKANDIVKLSKAVYAYVDPKKQEAFAKKALEISRKEGALTAGALFSKTMASSKELGNAVLDRYWERPFTPPVFGNFVEKRDRNLRPLRSLLRKSAAEGTISLEQELGLAKMFASLYTGRNKRGFVPNDYKSDFEAALRMLKGKKGTVEILGVLSGMRKYTGKAMEAAKSELSGKYSDTQILSALSALEPYGEADRKKVWAAFGATLSPRDSPEKISAKLSVPKELLRDLALLKSCREKGFSDEASSLLVPALSEYSQEKRQTALGDLGKSLPKNAKAAQARAAMLEHMRTHEGWLKSGALPRYASSSISGAVEENAQLSARLTRKMRAQIADYLSRGYLGRLKGEPLDYAQVSGTIDALGKHVSTNEGLSEMKKANMNVFMEEFVGRLYPPK